MSICFIVGFCLVFCGFHVLPLWAAISGLLAFLATAYYTFTFIAYNKFQDFNTSLEILESYFINKEFKRHNFDPELIPIYEDKLKKETEVLNLLIENKKNKTILLD